MDAQKLVKVAVIALAMASAQQGRARLCETDRLEDLVETLVATLVRGIPGQDQAQVRQMIWNYIDQIDKAHWVIVKSTDTNQIQYAVIRLTELITFNGDGPFTATDVAEHLERLEKLTK